jgi:hypothetical protein
MVGKAVTQHASFSLGEMTRVFTFNPTKSLFYLVSANFTQPGFNGKEPITLTTVDPAKGTTADLKV